MNIHLADESTPHRKVRVELMGIVHEPGRYKVLPDDTFETIFKMGGGKIVAKIYSESAVKSVGIIRPQSDGSSLTMIWWDGLASVRSGQFRYLRNNDQIVFRSGR